jgi:hypothetical protein
MPSTPGWSVILTVTVDPAEVVWGFTTREIAGGGGGCTGATAQHAAQHSTHRDSGKSSWEEDVLWAVG